MRFLLRVHVVGLDKLSMQELSFIYRRACNEQSTTILANCTEGPYSTAVHWQTNDGAATTRSLNDAASGYLGFNTPKQINWLLRANEAGVSDSLTP
jgi:hypothetical protein